MTNQKEHFFRMSATEGREFRAQQCDDLAHSNEGAAVVTRRISLLKQCSSTQLFATQVAGALSEVLNESPSLTDESAKAKSCRLTCWPFNDWVIGHLEFDEDAASFGDWCKQKFAASEFDYIIWPGREAPQLMLFDMDSTFIQIEVIDELARRAGVGEKVAAVTESAMRGELDFAESLVNRVACLKGLPVTVIDEIANDLPLSPGVDELVSRADNAGVKTSIVSGGFMPFVEKLRSQLPIFKVRANQLGVAEGKLSGEVLGAIVDAESKAQFLQELVAELKINRLQVLAIGDGANDLKMMEAAGFSLAYRAKPKVQAAAQGRFNKASLDMLAEVFGWSS